MVEITDSVGFVFVNTRCRAEPYETGDIPVYAHGYSARALFSQAFELGEIRVLTDLTDVKMKAEFNILEEKAKSAASRQKKLAIMIRWVGWHFESEDLIYGVSTDGVPVNVQNFCARLAENDSTYVILLQDWDSSKKLDPVDMSPEIGTLETK